MVRKIHAPDDLCQLLKRPADLRPFAGHRLQQERGGLLRLQHGVQGGCNLLYTRLDALLHMRTGMHVVQLMRRLLHTAEALGQHHEREIARLLLVGGGVQRVRRVRQDALDAMLGRIGGKGRDVFRVDGLRTAAARVAREELERVGVDGHGVLRHVEIALRA